MTTAQRAGPVRERLIAHLAAMLPDLDAKTAHDVLVAARVSEGRALRELDTYFRVHLGALAATPAEFPLALVRVAHALKEAGHRSAALPVCAGCGKITPRSAAQDRRWPGMRNLRGEPQYRNMRPVRPGQAHQRPARRGRDLLCLLRQGRTGA